MACRKQACRKVDHARLTKQNLAVRAALAFSRDDEEDLRAQLCTLARTVSAKTGGTCVICHRWMPQLQLKHTTCFKASCKRERQHQTRIARKQEVTAAVGAASGSACEHDGVRCLRSSTRMQALQWRP